MEISFFVHHVHMSWPFLMGGLLFRGYKQSFFQLFFCLQVSFCPVKRGNRVGSSRNESDYSDYLIFELCSRKLAVNQTGLCLINFFFLARKFQNDLVRNSRTCDNREAGKWPGYLSAISQTHSEKRGSISSLCGAVINFKA